MYSYLKILSFALFFRAFSDRHYVSNESPQNVYFDNVTVKQITGPLQQEQSYYPHGLPMAGISDKQLLKQITPYKANGGVELEEDYGLQTYNTDFRKYDPQIGRFNGVDALAELTGDLTPYQFGANDPVFWNDPSGLSLAAPARPNQGSATSISTPGITPTAFPTGSGSYSLPFSSGDPDESGGDNNESSSGGGGESNSGGDESASGGDGFSIGGNISAGTGYWSNGGTFTQSGGGSWSKLTKEVLNQLHYQYGGRNFTSIGEREDYIGDNFESNWHNYAQNLPFINYSPNNELSDHYDGGNDGSTPPAGHVRNVVIDAKAEVGKVELNAAGMTVKNYYQAAWFEVKATRSNIYLSTRNYQIYSEISHLVNSQPRAVAAGVAQYNIVTTYGGDYKVGQSVYDFAAKYGVQVLSIQPFYRINNGAVEVQFWHEMTFGPFRFPVPYSYIMTYKF
jgi:RHS repeat-associated protein